MTPPLLLQVHSQPHGDTRLLWRAKRAIHTLGAAWSEGDEVVSANIAGRVSSFGTDGEQPDRVHPEQRHDRQVVLLGEKLHLLRSQRGDMRSGESHSGWAAVGLGGR